MQKQFIKVGFIEVGTSSFQDGHIRSLEAGGLSASMKTSLLMKNNIDRTLFAHL